ncbi:hypothetical protein VIN7_6972 [Saccharomyces cerevisiae x Saccharomyces kudriavzevii VIN7]|uniref:Uncharacterized protein n=1 Tax=Saccharomyces cerevisiae x Saccharomyces kudriavzevii (strain VIN7) TaxID=1095631 RepID=H0GUI0_SACCK|nr:hypothetical protein VIN7_6972 [Saccharomyces cerevisiae x Saccharomyces kudriavzevii VIN7]CAI5267756.1 AIS_HP2_G0017140.mRNA.1.CDS.1 [Saccharomyces cerevisiae]CAI6496700.1 AIS_HP2_G0017140.mRNA.1.CDS.1 [Saccharomyces cerevisiae]
MNGNAGPKLKRGMLNLCFLLSLLFTCAQAVYYIDSDGAYIYNNASEMAKLIFLPPVPVYLAGFGKLQDIDHRNGTFKYFYNSSQVNMDYIDAVLAKGLYYNSDTNESVSKPHTEASRSYSVELTQSAS